MNDDDLPIVDAHHHLWDLEGAIRYPWLTDNSHTFLGDYSRFRRTYLPDEYRRDSALHNVVATVHVEAECDRSQQVAETEWVTAMHAQHGMPNAIVAHAWVDTPNAEEIIAAHCQFPLVRGVRTKPVIADGPNGSVRGQPRSLQDPKWRRGLALLEQYGLSWDLRVPWYHLEEAADVCREHPDHAHRAEPHRLSAGPFAGGGGRVAARHAGAGGMSECLVQDLGVHREEPGRGRWR